MGAGRRLKEPLKTDPIVWMEARKQLSLRKNKSLTRGDEEESPIFIPTTPDDHHKEALRKRSREESMEMTPWN